MVTKIQNQGIIKKLEQETHLATWISAFILDRKAQGMAKGTIYYYQMKLRLFTDYCDAQVITQITEITPNVIRLYLLYLQEKGHNEGGVNAAYRSLKTFLFWWENEMEPENWKNPIRKVKTPRNPQRVLDPVEIDTIYKLLDACDNRSFFGYRDKAVLYGLLDAGARASEFVAMDIDDLDLVSGAILIRKGKGSKPRTVFLGKKSRKAIRAYLRYRNDDEPALWITGDHDGRLSYMGLREIIRRRSRDAGIKPPSLHSFRRAFALNMLRAGVDVYSLQELMGHADLQILRRYLKQTNDDLKAAHSKGSPVDNLL